MRTREELIERLKDRFMPDGVSGFTYTEPTCRITDIADFIIEDRKRICEPLINVSTKSRVNDDPVNNIIILCFAARETLKLAGLDQTKERGDG